MLPESLISPASMIATAETQVVDESRLLRPHSDHNDHRNRRSPDLENGEHMMFSSVSRRGFLSDAGVLATLATTTDDISAPVPA